MRAVAIAAVLLYHLGVSGIRGGFLGVDIFLVLSGYFITVLVWERLDGGCLSLPGFYWSRLKRIAPAMLATIAFAYFYGAAILPPYLFKELSASAIYSSLGLANVYFWMQSGYFDLASASKPLLHLWSLAVELQFYAVAPLFLIVLHRFRHVAKPALVVGWSSAILAVASIVATNLEPTAAFYAMPLRLYEFGAGCTVALMPRRSISPARRYVVLLAALSLLLASVLFLDKPTRLGGVGMIVPVLATAFIIGNSSGTIVGAALALAAPLGRLAYALYLTHWPVIVYTTFALDRSDFTPLAQAAIAAATVVTALALHRWIELPFWRGGGVRRFPLRGVALAGLVLLATVSACFSWAYRGWPSRFPPSAIVRFVDVDASNEYVWANHRRWSGFGFGSPRPNLLVIGDSQSADLVNLLVEGGYDREVDLAAFRVVSECGVPFLPNEGRSYFLETLDPMTNARPDLTRLCKEQWDDLVADPRLGQADRVIISMVWRDFAMPYIQQVLDALRARTKAEFVVVGNKGMGKSSVELIETAASIVEAERAAALALDPAATTINTSIRALEGSAFFDMTQLICPQPVSCHVVTDDGYPILFDGLHLTKPGAQYLGTVGRPDILRLVGASSTTAL